MEFLTWINLVILFIAGGLTPGPAVMLVTSSAVRYGFWPAMAPALGVCMANLLWITLAAFGASALAHAYPEGFFLLRLAGVGFILWLASRIAFAPQVDLLRQDPPPRRGLLLKGVGLQILNPNALVYFGIALPMYIDTEHDLSVQVIIVMITVTACEMLGLVVYALGADALARRFQSKLFALWFFRIAALAMVASAGLALWATSR